MGTDLNKESAPTKIWVALMKAGALTGCHQLGERSFSISGFQFPLCARCTGILAGQFSALFSYSLYSGVPLLYIFALTAASVIILGTDGLGQLKGFWVSNNTRRLLTGLFCGFFASALFFRIAALLLNTLLNFLP